MQIIALLNHQFSYDIEYESCDIRGDTSKECLGSNHKTKVILWLKKGHQYAETASQKKVVIDRIRNSLFLSQNLKNRFSSILVV